jgi:anti-sigma regulatory factor (Ser/Thr protein kinase)
VRVGSRAGRAAVVLQVPSATEFLASIRDATRRVAELAGCDAQVAEQVALAVDEASTNVIEHAYRGARDRRVELRYTLAPDELRVEIVDDGAPVDKRSLPALDLVRYASERRTGGFGVHLMGRIMDTVTFRRTRQGNVCCMVKRLGVAHGREVR